VPNNKLPFSAFSLTPGTLFNIQLTLVAENVKDDEDIYVVPAFSGLGAPHWDMYARGAILGLTQGVTDKHIVKATIEALAYRTKDVLDAMSRDSGIELTELNVDGGASLFERLQFYLPG